MVRIPEGTQTIDGSKIMFVQDPQQDRPDDVKIELSDEHYQKYATPDKRRDLFSYTYKVQTSPFNSKTKRVHLYDLPPGTRTLYLKRGLLPRVKDLRDELAYFPPLTEHPTIPSTPTPRLYQEALYHSILDQLRMCGASSIFAAAGSGKTEIAIYIARSLLRENIVDNIYYLTLNRTLVRQTADRFREYGYGDQVGMVMGGYHQYDRPVTCATVQTLFQNLFERDEREPGEDKEGSGERKGRGYTYTLLEDPGKLGENYHNADLIIVDEMQHVPATTIKKTVFANKRALRVGMSATPWRWDGRTLEIYAYMGDLVKPEVTPSALIRNDDPDLYPEPYLVPPIIYLYRFTSPGYETTWEIQAMASQLIKMKKNPWHMVLKEVLYDEQRINEIGKICSLLNQFGMDPMMVMCRQVREANRIWKNLLKEQQMESEVLTGQMDKDTRQRFIRKAQAEEISALVTTPIAHEGLDIPNLRSIILTTGGKSSVQTYQKVGRVLRPGPPDKQFGIVIDFADRAAYLNKHWRVRKGAVPPDKLGRMEARGYDDEEEWVANVVGAYDELKQQLKSYAVL